MNFSSEHGTLAASWSFWEAPSNHNSKSSKIRPLGGNLSKLNPNWQIFWSLPWHHDLSENLPPCQPYDCTCPISTKGEEAKFKNHLSLEQAKDRKRKIWSHKCDFSHSSSFIACLLVFVLFDLFSGVGRCLLLQLLSSHHQTLVLSDNF